MSNEERPILGSNDEDYMVCPGCGMTSGLHIDGVEVNTASGQWVRVIASGEDDDSEVQMTRGITAGGEGRRAPYNIGRRHAITLLYWCEHCDIPSTNFGEDLDQCIELRQHKGATVVSRYRLGWTQA